MDAKQVQWIMILISHNKSFRIHIQVQKYASILIKTHFEFCFPFKISSVIRKILLENEHSRSMCGYERFLWTNVNSSMFSDNCIVQWNPMKTALSFLFEITGAHHYRGSIQTHNAPILNCASLYYVVVSSVSYLFAYSTFIWMNRRITNTSMLASETTKKTRTVSTIHWLRLCVR